MDKSSGTYIHCYFAVKWFMVVQDETSCFPDLSEENRGLLSSSQASSGTDFQSTETLTEGASVPKTGYDFLDNW